MRSPSDLSQPVHDPDVCGLDLQLCPGCAAELRVQSSVRAELLQLCARWSQADDFAHRLRSYGDVGGAGDAEDARREIEGEHHAVELGLSDLAAMLLRYAVRHQPGVVRTHLEPIIMDVMRPELEAIAQRVARLELRP